MEKILLLRFLVLACFFGASAQAYVDESSPPLETFSAYQPLFFVLGKPHTKFQISFKAKIVEAVPLYLGYRQTSFWDLFRYSAPFSDTAYAPDLFYRFTGGQGQISFLDVGFLHESNGRDGDASRAWNRPFVRYSFIENFSSSQLYWSAQAWVPITNEDQSQDLPKYKGIYELTATWAHFLGKSFDRDDLTLRLYPGGSIYINPFLGGQELTLRLKGAERKFLPLFIVQMFHGYGESLLEYKDEVWVVRAGFGL